ncbi:hypothetical protein FRB99_006897 [Tulasnella sp. 403]|nr:hypothetical protein FRB99_006897 [Tulasnella sp. 403]
MAMDHSLTFAIDVALNILPIAQFLQAMWPCVGSVPAMMSSADNDDRLTLIFVVVFDYPRTLHPYQVCQRNISNHPDHYYEDGNFIFVVENFVFRIHRSLLARRSGVMQSMLSLPQGPSSSDGPSTSMNDQPMIDGVPAVTLHDKAEDFANVLDFIYPRQVSDSGVSPPPILPLNTLMGITRICGKYDIEDIRTWAISQMEAVLPTTSETLDKIPIYDDPSVAVDVINISRECGLPQFLPLAFYALATTEWSSDVDAPTLVLGSLSEDDRDRILMGRAGLQKEVLKRAYQMPENGLTQRKCGKCSKGTLEAWINPEERWTRLLLHPLEEITQRLAWEYLAYCLGSCRKDAVKGAQAFREDLVQRLPTIFRLVAL